MMSKLTLQQQQEMVDTSIMNQYKGLFLPRQQQTAHQTTKNTLDNFDKFYDEYYGQETEVIDTTTVQVAHQGENNGIA